MFSGIVEEVGSVLDIVQKDDGQRLRIAAEAVISDARVGDSISVSGVCLTVTKLDLEAASAFFEVDAVPETLRRTRLGALKVGSRVNLERALRVNDRMGGHLVTGHIDALAKVDSIEEDGFSKLFTFKLAGEWYPYFVEKGSVAVDGVSLTVIDCVRCNPMQLSVGETMDEIRFRVALIPHTLEVTTLGELDLGDQVNIETDIIARYVARWLEPSVQGMIVNKDTATSFVRQ